MRASGVRGHLGMSQTREVHQHFPDVCPSSGSAFTPSQPPHQPRFPRFFAVCFRLPPLLPPLWGRQKWTPPMPAFCLSFIQGKIEGWRPHATRNVTAGEIYWFKLKQYLTKLCPYAFYCRQFFQLALNCFLKLVKYAGNAAFKVN